MGKRAYEQAGWVRGDSIGDGNQGFTFLARRQNDSDDEWPYVLKRLKRQQDADARRRMHVEVATLETLDHSGVVEFVESNAREFRTAADLFLVTSRVNGTDLQKLVTDGGPVSIRDTVTILTGVLRTLAFCHTKRVVHRDIKPCHIILRHGDLAQPVLIDFGLSFNEQLEEGDASTASHMGVGNRFIGLPEQQAGSGDKRDIRSDVTQCVAVLFYLLTGEVPHFIHDASQRKPHEQTDFTQRIVDLDSPRAAILRRVFDIGFEYDPRRRWQSAAALASEMGKLVGESTGVLPFDARLDDLSSRLAKSPATTEQARLLSLQSELEARVRELGHVAHCKLGDHVLIQPSVSGRIVPTPHTYPMILGFVVTTNAQHRQVHLNHTCHPVGGEIILRRNDSIAQAGCFMPDRHATEVLRIGLFDPLAADRIIGVLESVLIETVSTLYDSTS